MTSFSPPPSPSAHSRRSVPSRVRILKSTIAVVIVSLLLFPSTRVKIVQKVKIFSRKAPQIHARNRSNSRSPWRETKKKRTCARKSPLFLSFVLSREGAFFSFFLLKGGIFSNVDGSDSFFPLLSSSSNNITTGHVQQMGERETRTPLRRGPLRTQAESHDEVRRSFAGG